MIQPGLERIGQLLKNVELPWKAIHVAGTNGKGSICGLSSAMLSRRIIRNGCFTSPHIINRWDCIAINNKPVHEKDFRTVEDHFIQLNKREGINASEFELLTACAFQIFTDKKVDVGVVEVGMGGQLDATNILNNQVVSVISKIARDHENFLGGTLEEIARHKAGILRPNVPFIINPLNELQVREVIEKHAQEIGAGPRILHDTAELREEVFKRKIWHKAADSLLPFQRDNLVLAFLAVMEALKSLNEGTKKAATKLLPAMKNRKMPGRLQFLSVGPVFGRRSRRQVLIDGAHNPDAAAALAEYVNQHLRRRKWDGKGNRTPPGGWPVTWVLAMTQGKDVRQYLTKLIRPIDQVVTTSFSPVDGMPWVKPMDPKELLEIVREVQPGVKAVHVSEPGAFRAICTAKHLQDKEEQIVLTGSLYLTGEFLREKEITGEDLSSMETKMKKVEVEELMRVRKIYKVQAKNTEPGAKDGNEEEKRRLLGELEELDQQLQLLEAQTGTTVQTDTTQDTSSAIDGQPELVITPSSKSQNTEEKGSTKQKLYKNFQKIQEQLAQSLVHPSSKKKDDDGLRRIIGEVQHRPYLNQVRAGKAGPRIRTHASLGLGHPRILKRTSNFGSDKHEDVRQRLAEKEQGKPAEKQGGSVKKKQSNVVRKTQPLNIRCHAQGLSGREDKLFSPDVIRKSESLSFGRR